MTPRILSKPYESHRKLKHEVSKELKKARDVLSASHGTDVSYGFVSNQKRSYLKFVCLDFAEWERPLISQPFNYEQH